LYHSNVHITNSNLLVDFSNSAGKMLYEANSYSREGQCERYFNITTDGYGTFDITYRMLLFP